MVEQLNFEIFGDSKEQKPVVIAHGLFGSGRNWRSVAKKISDLGRKVIVVDMRNHGSSFWHKSHCYEDLAVDLLDIVTAFGGSADIIGHSMGGKAAMVLALLYPQCVNKLVVVDIAPVKYFHDQSDYISAMENVNLSLVNNRNDLDRQLAVTIDDLTLRTFFSQSVNFSKGNEKRWLLNLSSIKRNLPYIMNFPKLNAKALCQSLFIRGSLSHYVSDEYLSSIEKYFPNYQVATIEGAGHWIHAEKFSEFNHEVIGFLLD